MFRIGRLIPNFLFESTFNFLAFMAMTPIILNPSNYSMGPLLSIIVIIGNRLAILSLPLMQSFMNIWWPTENASTHTANTLPIIMPDYNPLQAILDEKDIPSDWIPAQFQCPISGMIIWGSAQIAKDSHHWFSMDVLLCSLKVNSINPMTREKISEKDVIRDARHIYHDYAIYLFVNYLLLNQERLKSLPPKEAIAETEVVAEKAKHFFSEQNIKTLLYFSSSLFKRDGSQHTFFMPLRANTSNNFTKSIADFMEKHGSCYAVLDLPPDCDAKTIQHQYYALAKKLHPDKSEGSQQTFQIILAAKTILLDVKQRAIHDKLLSRLQQNIKNTNSR
jgi:hypothetical protein